MKQKKLRLENITIGFMKMKNNEINQKNEAVIYDSLKDFLTIRIFGFGLKFFYKPLTKPDEYKYYQYCFGKWKLKLI